ncbi:MAG: hypothetical protein ABSE73_18865 [Planctomycetota bacterium]
MGNSPAVVIERSLHEALCNHCGKCCYKKIFIGSTVHITPFPCKYLDIKTNLCTVYERRHEVNRFCLSVEEGLRVSAFPRDCPYVGALAPPGYRPARDDWDWDGEWENFDDLADDLGVTSEIRELVRARGPEAPPLYIESGKPRA